jgi:PTS system N-acetylglucosamine-specific IIC component
MKKYIYTAGKLLVELGKSLMLPIAVLPVAGLLLRLGQPDILNVLFIAKAGGAIFDNLALIFALGVAVGYAKESHGAAALSALVGYLVMTAGLKEISPNVDMGVFGGIIIGASAGMLYNKYKDIKLPSYLAFFGGKRFIPIIMGLTALFYALLFSYVWPSLQTLIKMLGDWITGSGNIGLFSYGFANRMIIPVGLHHILNTLVWFQFGDYAVMQAGAEMIKHGDLTRFFAGDPSAGSFMAGFFPVMMFGLPAAALAIIAEASPKNKKNVAGIFISAALTSFLTGITEPIEFAFMFVAFPLYILHAALTGFSMVVMNMLGVKLGFSFSAGLFDYLINFGISTKPLLLMPTGLAYGALYYFLFRFSIRKWDLKTPGRQEDVSVSASIAGSARAPAVDDPSQCDSPAKSYLSALGGKDNIKSISACATRLRLEVCDNKKIDEAALKAAGAKGVINNISGSAQVVVGLEADILCDRIKAAMK